MASVSKKNMKTNRIVSNDSTKARGIVSNKNMIIYVYVSVSRFSSENMDDYISVSRF